MRQALALALALALAAVLALPAQAASERPIVYVVVLDGLDGDKVEAGRAPYISSLLAGRDARSTYYRESRSIMISETNPNHTAMMTGAYGSSSGIPGNAFGLYAPLENEDSCRATGPVDETKKPTETSGENANCPQAQMVFEAIKRQGNPDGVTTAAIFGKPKLGRIFAGRKADGRTRDVDHLWAPCTSGSDDDEYCGRVPLNPVNGYALDDRTVMNEVIRSMNAGVGPRHERPDFTFVNLHQVDSAGHASGTGLLYDIAIAQADAEIRRLVNTLKARGEWDRTALILASDHSMDTTLAKTTLSNRLGSAGIGDDRYVVIDNGSTDMIYLANRRDPNRFELLRRMRQAVLGAPGANEALYREPNPLDGGSRNTLDGARPGWRLGGPRTGDLIVTHDPGGAFSDPSSSSNPLPGNHGGPFTRDNFIAVSGGLRGGFGAVRQQALGAFRSPVFDDTLQNPGQAENADLSSTVMGLFGLFSTRDNAGRFLNESFDLPQVPGATAPARRAQLRVRRNRRVRSLRVRSRRRCRRLRRSRVALRVAVGPEGGRYDVGIRRTGRGGRRYRAVQRNRARDVVVVKVRQNRPYRFRARIRSASGKAGRWRGVSTRVRPYRCG